MDSQYDFSGTTVNGPSFFISFDASPHGQPTNLTFSVNDQPITGVAGTFNWYETVMDVSTGALGFFNTSPGVTTFMGEVDNPIFRPNDGTPLGDLFYQGNTYTLASLTVTDPPVTSVPEPWGWIGVMLFALTLWCAVQFAPKGPGDMP